MNCILVTPVGNESLGGIAQYNRDIIISLNEIEIITRLDVLQSTKITDEKENKKKGKINTYGGSVLKAIKYAFWQTSKNKYNIVLCAHINMLPVATIIAAKNRAKLILIVYGVDVWSKPKKPLIELCLKYVNTVWTISEFTMKKMSEWCKFRNINYTLIPNGIDIKKYGIGNKRVDFIEKYNKKNSNVLMTLGRLSAAEQYKGIDEVIELMPKVLMKYQNIIYLIVGEGDDKPRLQKKVENLGLEGNVIFTGYVSDEHKADIIRIADVFIMPGKGEGFGFVYLEAMACGIPVIGSKLDGSQEALLNGKIGEVVDPTNQMEMMDAIEKCLKTPKKIPEDLWRFSIKNFKKKVKEEILSNIKRIVQTHTEKSHNR